MTRAVDSTVAWAMAGAAAIGAQFVAGKAVRDALFLTHFDPASLPPMIIGTALFSIVLVAAAARFLRRIAPAVYVPVAFAVSAILLLVQWLLASRLPPLAAVVLFLHVSGLGPMLGSGFWLIASERFDPRTAKQRYGQIAGAATLGGLAGALAAAEITALAGIAAVLPAIAALNAACAWLAHSLARTGTDSPRTHPADGAPAERSPLRVLAEVPYLRSLAWFVLLGTIAATVVDYVFKVQVTSSMASGAALGRFFALFHGGVSLLTFVIQTLAGRVVLEKLGLTAALSAPAITVAVGASTSLIVPGLPGVMATAAGESVMRGSLFRSGYELFFTPIASADKRAVKAAIDVGVNRSAEIIGAGVIQIVQWITGNSTSTLLWLALGCSLPPLVIARRVSRGYVIALKHSLMSRAVAIDLSDVPDRMTRTIVLQAIDRGRGGDATLDRALVPSVIRKLDDDASAAEAVRALRTVADEHIEELLAALLDPDQPFAVRRRLASALSSCRSQRAADGLMQGLQDLRFEVRFRCGQSLAAMIEQGHARIDPARVLDVVHREITVSQRVWEGRRLIDDDAITGEAAPIEEFVAERSGRALSHVFNLLRMVLGAEAVVIAYRGLQTSDRNLRGTALEYLESVLPDDIRERLWPFLDDDRATRGRARPREEILDDLFRSHQSILLNLEEVKARRQG
jgi:hypothetical protein